MTLSVPLTSWVLTDGKAGDELQALSVAEAIGLHPEVRRVRPRAPFSWLMPWGPIDPGERPGAHNSPLAPPFPDIVIASGRRSVPYLRFIKHASGGRTYTVFLKDPRTGPNAADLIWAPSYDRIRGPNVLNTLTPPHRVSPERLALARAVPDERLAALPQPRVAVLAGGNSRHHRFKDADVARFAGDLATLAKTGAGLMITVSRRTPEALRDSLRDLARQHRRLLLRRRRFQPICGDAGARRFHRRDGGFVQYDRRSRGHGRSRAGFRTSRGPSQTRHLPSRLESRWNCAWFSWSA